jgi:hypothetical protein
MSEPQDTNEAADSRSDGRDDALKAAVEAIYFNDNSDYETALWIVVRSLGGDEAVELLERDGSAAYQIYVDNAKLRNTTDD